MVAAATDAAATGAASATSAAAIAATSAAIAATAAAIAAVAASTAGAAVNILYSEISLSQFRENPISLGSVHVFDYCTSRVISQTETCERGVG